MEHLRMSNIIVYTKPGCGYCTQAKALLASKNLSFIEMTLGKELTREEFIGLFPEVKVLPFIIADGKHVGGYDNLIEWTERPEQQFLAE